MRPIDSIGMPKRRLFWRVLLACGLLGGCGDAKPSVSAIHANDVMSISVKGRQFIDANGNVVQLRGVNVSGLEGGAIAGAAHPWDYSKLVTSSKSEPDWSKIVAWKVNAVRLPLNEASWLGISVTYSDGHTGKADPSGDYQATVMKSVKDANAAGLYVILEMQWNAPGDFAPVTQNPFMDSDHSLAFWTSIANTFKNNSAVIFELFNEPFLHPASNGDDGVFADDQNWNKAIRDGGITALYYRTLSGGTKGSVVKLPYKWTVIGYQAGIDAVRAAGATNVIILGGQGYDNDETWWAQYPPSDPLRRLALTYHAYPTTWGFELTGTSTQHSAAQSIAVLNAPGVPVILTEVGGPTGTGASTTFVSNILKLVDAQGWSALAWTWNPWGGADTLIQDNSSYIPTEGEGVIYHTWTSIHQ
jgi:endoglucanase